MPSRPVRLLALTAAVALAAPVLATGPATAAPSTPRWQPAVTLSAPTSGFSSAAEVGQDGRGNTAAVWVEDGQVRYAVRPAGGSYGASRPLSSPGSSVSEVHLATDDRGDAVAVWPEFVGSAQVIMAAARPAGKGVSQPFAVSDGGNPTAPAVALDDAGNAVVAWTDYQRGVVVRTGSLDGGLSPTTQVLSAPGEGGVSVAAAGRGEAVVGWGALGADGTYVARLARRHGAAAPFGAPETVSGPRSSSAVVTVDDRGDAVATWQRFRPVGSDYVPYVEAATAGRSTAFGAPTTISGPDADEPVIASSSAGDAIIAWRPTDGPLRVSERDGTGPFGAPRTVSTLSAAYPTVAMDEAGDAVLAWTGYRADGTPVVQAAVRPADGRFGVVRTLSRPDDQGAFPAADIASRSSAAVGWSGSPADNSGSTAAMAAAYE